MIISSETLGIFQTLAGVFTACFWRDDHQQQSGWLGEGWYSHISVDFWQPKSHTQRVFVCPGRAKSACTREREEAAAQKQEPSSASQTREPAAGVQSQTEEEQMAGDTHLARQTLPHAEDLELLSAAQTHGEELQSQLQSHEHTRPAAGDFITCLSCSQRRAEHTHTSWFPENISAPSHTCVDVSTQIKTMLRNISLCSDFSAVLHIMSSTTDQTIIFSSAEEQPTAEKKGYLML